LQRLREGAKELIAQLHRGDLERILQRPVVVRRVSALASPEEELDELDLDGGLELGVGLRRRLSLDHGDLWGFVLALAFAGPLASGNDRWGDGFRAADAPGGCARRLRRGWRLRHQAGTQRGQVV